MRLIDRYVVREILPPFFLALGVFTFIVAVNPMFEYIRQYLSKGVPLGTVGYLLMTLLPQAFGITIPMATLTGVLIALGRMSADREPVALLACGLSPNRLLRPILVVAVVACLANLYTMVKLVPDSNQMFREITYRHLIQRTEADIKSGEFYDGFPNQILLVRDVQPGGRWLGVLIASTTDQDRVQVTLADEGRLELDAQRQEVRITLTRARRYVPGADGASYTVSPAEMVLIRITAADVFGAGGLSRGLPELHIADLNAQIAEKKKRGESPHNEIMFIQQKFAFPVACLTFGFMGLALGLHTRQEGKFAGLALGLGGILVYFALHAQAEDWTKGGGFPAVWARWLPNLVLLPLSIAALWWRSRAVGRDITIALPRRFTARARALSTAAGRGDRVVLVIRVPEFRIPRPRLLDLYIVKRYLKLVALSFVAILSLYYIATFLDESEYLFKGRATWGMVITHLWYSTPQFIAFTIPVATLVAVLATIGGLMRTGELTVMRACGVSLYRAAVPLLCFALVGSAILFALEDRVLAQANRQASFLKADIRNIPRPAVQHLRLNWLVSKDGSTYYHYLGFDPAAERLFRASILHTASNPYRLESHTTADQAVFRDGAWVANTGWTQRFAPDDVTSRETFENRVLPDMEAPRYFNEARIDDTPMTFMELRDYLSRYQNRGFNLAEQQVSLWRKIAMPCATIVMTILAVPFGLTTGRRGALYGIGLAVALAFAHQFLAVIFTAAGQAGLLPAWFSAWAANILFLAGAVYLMFTVRT